jgi:hypothetical protein
MQLDRTWKMNFAIGVLCVLAAASPSDVYGTGCAGTDCTCPSTCGDGCNCDYSTPLPCNCTNPGTCHYCPLSGCRDGSPCGALDTTCDTGGGNHCCPTAVTTGAGAACTHCANGGNPGCSSQTCKSAAGCAETCPTDASTDACKTCSNYTGADKCSKEACKSTAGCVVTCPQDASTAGCDTCSNYTGADKCSKETCKSAAGCVSTCPTDASTAGCDTCSNYTGADKCSKETCKSAAGCGTACPTDASTALCNTCSNYTGADKCESTVCYITPSIGCGTGCPAGGEDAYQGGGAACETCSNYTGATKKCEVKICPTGETCEGGDAHYSHCCGSTAGTYHCDKYCGNDSTEPSCVAQGDKGTFCCGGCGREGYTYTGCPAAWPGQEGCETESTTPPSHCRDGMGSCLALTNYCICSGGDAPCKTSPGAGNCKTCGHHPTECNNNNGECKGDGGYNSQCTNCSQWWCDSDHPCGVPGDCQRSECHQ